MTNTNSARTGRDIAKAVNDDLRPEEGSATPGQSNPVDKPAPPTLARWRDAEVRGPASPDWQAALAEKFPFMLGGVVPENPRAGTLNGQWKNAVVTLEKMIVGREQDGRKEAIGFGHHAASKQKAGFAYVFGHSEKGARKAEAMTHTRFLALDCDAGTGLERTIETIEGLGIAAFLYTTHTHNTTTLALPAGKVAKVCGPKIDDAAIREYLSTHDRHPWSADFIAGCTYGGRRDEGSPGEKVLVKTPPQEKFRIVIPLAERIDLRALAEDPQDALGVYAEKVVGLARELLDVHFDPACTDPCRAFYTARHHPDDNDWRCVIIRGRLLDWADVPTASKDAYLATLRPETAEPSRRSGTTTKATRKKATKSKDTVPNKLKSWAAKYGKRFLLADYVRHHAPDDICNEKKGGKMLIVDCPAAEMHGDGGKRDTACHVRSGNGKKRSFAFECKHGSCPDDRLALLNAFMAKHDLKFASLKDEQFLVSDDEDGPYAWLPGDVTYSEESEWFVEERFVGEDVYEVPICRAFESVGRSASLDGEANTGRIIAFRNENGKDIELTLDRADLFKKDSNGVIDRLADAGMELGLADTKWRQTMVAILQSVTSERLIATTPRPGWVRRHDDVLGFMTPTGQWMDAGSGAHIRLHENGLAQDRTTRGDLESWKAGIGMALASGVDHFVIAVGAAFAGPILGLHDGLPCGLNFSGETSRGKTVAQSLAASAWTNPAPRQGVLHSMNSTANAVEDLAVMGSDAVLCLDEIGALGDARMLTAMLFGLSSGIGKSRKKGRGAGLAASAAFRPFVIMSNEWNLRRVIAAAAGKESIKRGTTVRFLDIDVTGSRQIEPDMISGIIKGSRNYGHAGPAFVQWLIDNDWPRRRSELDARLTAAQGTLASSAQPPAIQRAAKVLAYVIVGAELAGEAGLIDPGPVKDAVDRAFARFMRGKDGETLKGHEATLDALRAALATHIGRVFIPVEEADTAKYGAPAGWVTADHYIIAKDAFDTPALGLQETTDECLAALRSINALEKSGKDYSFSNLPQGLLIAGREGSRVRNIRIKRTVLDGDESRVAEEEAPRTDG